MASANTSEQEVADMLRRGQINAFIAFVVDVRSYPDGSVRECPVEVGMACYYRGYHIRGGSVRILRTFGRFEIPLPWDSFQHMQMNNFYVRSQYRRRGIATRLMDALVRVAYEEGFGRIVWDCLEKNTSAVEFYAKRYKATNLSQAFGLSLFMIGRDTIDSLLKER
jgi:GNAT superfamily N-acetyltransferase